MTPGADVSTFLDNHFLQWLLSHGFYYDEAGNMRCDGTTITAAEWNALIEKALPTSGERHPGGQAKPLLGGTWQN